jgi:hypothetical protein
VSEEQQAPETDAPEQPQEGKGEPEAFDADYVAKLRKEAAKYRTEAKANADAAKRLAEIEDSQKTETEKAAERIAKAEAEVAAVPTKVAAALRDHLIILHEIDQDDAELFLTANEPDLLLKQVTRLVGQSDKRKKNGNVVVREGATPTPSGSDDKRTFLRTLASRD